MWATVDDVAAHMRIPVDDYMADKLEVALDWAARRRPDLNRYAPQDAQIREAVCIYASMLYRAGASPQMPGNPGDVQVDAFDGYGRAMDLLGARKPVAR
jgi:hypothetical protein